MLVSVAGALVVAGCSTTPPNLPPGPLSVHVDVVERGWHTELCLAPDDLSGRLTAVAAGFPGARFLCFGFGERAYMMDRDHSPLVMVTSMLPSDAVMLVLPLQEEPVTTFDPAREDAEVVPLRISAAGAAHLSDFIWTSVRSAADGRPVRLGPGVNAGSLFYAASGSYSALATCNTWTASALRQSGLPINDAVAFTDDVMVQVRKLAAQQAVLP